MAVDGDSGDSSNDSGAAVGEVTINVRCSNNTKFPVKISLQSTVSGFKTIIAQNCDVPAENQRLIYKGRILKDDQTLESYSLEAEHTVHMVRGLPPTSATTGGTNTGVPNSGAGATRGVSSTEGGGLGGAGLGSLFPGLGANPLGGNGGSGGLFGAGIPEFEQMQQQLTQNPNMMREIMNMPAIQNLVNNPDIMRNMIMSNPQMRDIIDRNPELAHILNDPNTLRQTLEAARNPELMREMMRNTDRAMSNIESSPEGFNMLRRMYETVQEPFLNATTLSGETGNDAGANPFAALLGNQVGSQVNRSTPTNTGSETTTGSPVPNTNPLPNPWSGRAAGGAPTNATTRSTPATDARAAGIAGLGGLGLPDLFGGGIQDPSQLAQMMQNPAVTQMMQNPAVTQMMQSLLSNPQAMNQLIGLNPQLRSMMDSNPDLLRQLSNPETMQQVMNLQQSLFSGLGRQQPTTEGGPTVGGTGTGANMDLLMNMFSGLGAGAPASNVPPEQLYATQLTQLQEMGFYDTQENIRALSATAGNVHAAVERLLGNLGQ
ncbi:hypothetical protein ACHQM5_015873 [Ranunculus cassubicifolius]